MSGLLILNFSHPLTPSQRTAIEDEVGRRIDRVVDVPVHFDHDQPFDAQVVELLASIDIDWQHTPMLVILPAFSLIAAVLLARLHGITGHFPTIVRLKPIPDTAVREFAFAELLPLDQIRHDARASAHARHR